MSPPPERIDVKKRMSPPSATKGSYSSEGDAIPSMGCGAHQGASASGRAGRVACHSCARPGVLRSLANQSLSPSREMAGHHSSFDDDSSGTRDGVPQGWSAPVRCDVHRSFVPARVDMKYSSSMSPVNVGSSSIASGSDSAVTSAGVVNRGAVAGGTAPPSSRVVTRISRPRPQAAASTGSSMRAVWATLTHRPQFVMVQGVVFRFSKQPASGEPAPAPSGVRPDQLAPLARAAAAGAPEAATTLVLQLGGPILKVVRKVLGARHPDVDDVAQDTVIALLRSLQTVRGDCTVERIAQRITLQTAQAARW